MQDNKLAWVGAAFGAAMGVVFFVLTGAPFWIGVGLAFGAAAGVYLSRHPR